MTSTCCTCCCLSQTRKVVQAVHNLMHAWNVDPTSEQHCCQPRPVEDVQAHILCIESAVLPASRSSWSLCCRWLFNGISNPASSASTRSTAHLLTSCSSPGAAAASCAVCMLVKSTSAALLTMLLLLGSTADVISCGLTIAGCCWLVEHIQLKMLCKLCLQVGNVCRSRSRARCALYQKVWQ